MRSACRLGLAVSILALPAAGAPPAATRNVADLGFLAGSWVSDAGPTRVEEQWLCPGPDTMIGMGRTTSRTPAKTVFFEYLRIESRAEGLVYVAQPRGGPATEFPLVRLEAGTAVFENLAHDFPKRILYSKGADGRLTARVEGDPRDREQAQEVHYHAATAGCR